MFGLHFEFPGHHESGPAKKRYENITDRESLEKILAEKMEKLTEIEKGYAEEIDEKSSELDEEIEELEERLAAFEK